MSELPALAELLRAAVLEERSVEIDGFGRFVPATIGRVRTLIFRTAPALKAALLGGPPPTVDPRVTELVARLLVDEPVDVEGAGSFRVKTRRAFRGPDPRTGEVADIPEARLVLFRMDKELRAAANHAPDPFAEPGSLQLDRRTGRNLVVRPPPGAPSGRDLLAALADPRMAEVRRLVVKGATDGDARGLAAVSEGLEHVELVAGSVSDLGAAALAGMAWPRLQRLVLDDNAIGPDGLEALAPLPGVEPGLQAAPFGSPSLFAEQLALPWEDLDPLLDRWGARLVDALAEVLDLEGLDSSALRGVTPEVVPDKRWPSLPAPDLSVRWLGWRRAVAAVQPSDTPRGRAVARLLALAQDALDRTVAGGLEGAYGNDFGWACDLGAAVAVAEGSLGRWKQGTTPALLPDADVLGELHDEVEALHP